MRAARSLVLALAVSIPSWAGAAAVDPADAWRPMHPFMGTWKGTRQGSDGTIKVTRVFATAPTNRHLEITESDGGRSRTAVWGIVSLDRERGLLVLRQFGADGLASDLTLVPAASSGEQLVFATPESEAARVRITYERADAKTLIERIEQSASGAPLALVSEMRFVRSN
jgi:hypothetical protein